MPDPFKFDLVSPERVLVSGEVEQFGSASYFNGPALFEPFGS
jgi:hypothetical protein